MCVLFPNRQHPLEHFRGAQTGPQVSGSRSDYISGITEGMEIKTSAPSCLLSREELSVCKAKLEKRHSVEGTEADSLAFNRVFEQAQPRRRSEGIIAALPSEKVGGRSQASDGESRLDLCSKHRGRDNEKYRFHGFGSQLT